MANLKMLFFTFCTILFVSATAQQPTIKILESGKRISIRGLSVVNDNVIWASGTGGSVARSTDGGNSFTWIKVPGYEKMDFRDIEAFDSNTAIIMGITAPAVILKTKDGGRTWKTVFEDTTKGAFLDAMYFKENPNDGQVIGDPVFNLQIYTLLTTDQGDTWKLINGSDRLSELNTLNEGEAFFASSGTNFVVRGNHFQAYVSGGRSSRLFTALRRDSLPIMQGKESTGANSIAVYQNKGVIVGGDFAKDTISSNNCVLVDFSDFEKPVFNIPKSSPHGYRSCVIYLTKKKLLTCGTSGVDISKDGGKNWQLIAKDGFHVCQKAKKGKTVFLAGGGGKIAKLVY
jgi:photosystem II stability/assembly factor-like uncharacterized protein